MDKDFMLNYYDKMVRPIWTELMKTSRYQRVACERSCHDPAVGIQLHLQSQPAHQPEAEAAGG